MTSCAVSDPPPNCHPNLLLVWWTLLSSSYSLYSSHVKYIGAFWLARCCLIIIIIIIIIYFSHECNLHGTSTMTQEDIHVISMPAGFRRRLVGKTLRNVCHCNIAEILFADKLFIIQTFYINQRIECYFNNTINLRLLTALVPTKWRSYLDHRFYDVILSSV